MYMFTHYIRRQGVRLPGLGRPPWLRGSSCLVAAAAWHAWPAACPAQGMPGPGQAWPWACLACSMRGPGRGQRSALVGPQAGPWPILGLATGQSLCRVAGQARPGQTKVQRPVQARPDQARQGLAEPGQARPDRARQGQAGPARPGQPGQARPGQPRQARPGQDRPSLARRSCRGR